MKRIIEIKGKRTFAEPGVYGYDAEAVVAESDGRKVYAHANAFEDYEQYTISGKSIYEFMTGDGEEPEVTYDEEYETLDDAKGSAYYGVFAVLQKMIDAMQSGVE